MWDDEHILLSGISVVAGIGFMNRERLIGLTGRNSMKIISMYLPQFHRVKENDEWWGEGYTDWVSAKNATPLFEGHYQPHIPLNQNYYDLMEKSTFEWQASLMKKYGIDGQCIYHYWFKDGRQILEKPLERLLDWREIELRFCICWANQSWANSWSAVKGANIWCDARESKERTGDGLLLEQQYGDEKEWKHHFEYLLPFFQDERYIKKHNKPVFVLYQTEQITVLEEMSDCWNTWAKEAGFDGIYFIGANCGEQKLTDVILCPGPQTAMREMLRGVSTAEIRILDYSDVWKNTIQCAYLSSGCLAGAFTGYDDVPRRGKKGCVIDHASPEVFGENLKKLLAINEIHGHSFTFINAWNEWGEGMHLEPDEKDGFAYLEAVLDAKDHYKEFLEEARYIAETFYKRPENEIRQYKDIIKKYESFWRIMDRLLALKEDNLSLSDLLKEKNIFSVAVYGVGMVGRHIIRELSDGGIDIVCAIDRKNVSDEFKFPVVKPDERIPKVDAVIVTPSYDFQNIKRQLRQKGVHKIISIETLLMETMQEA